MCSAGDCWLVVVSVARLVEEGHGAFGEVAASDGALVVLVGEHGADEADRGAVTVGGDPRGDDHGPGNDLAQASSRTWT